MTDEMIIKALECCGDEELKCCSICPLYIENHENDFCQEDLHRASLDLIKRQKAEIERLKDLNAVLETDNINANMNLEHITYEFGLLKQEKSVVEAEAIKDFAERLVHTLVINNEENTEFFDFSYTLETIDNLVKEMIGEKE